MSGTTTIRLNDQQRRKLQQLADALGSNRNATMGMLIENAEIVPVLRHEAVATLTATKNSDSAKFSQDGSAITVAA